MSLFGSSPEEGSDQRDSGRLSKSSLFADDPVGSSTRAPGSALFSDDNNHDATAGGDSSPWSMLTPKRAARHELVKSLLPPTDVPESYIDAYDAIVSSADHSVASQTVSLSVVRDLLASTGLGADVQSRIVNLVAPGGQDSVSGGLSRNEFNVLLALIGLAQEGEDVTLDAVDERRRKLPQPRIPYLDGLSSHEGQSPSQQARPSTPPSTSQPYQQTPTTTAAFRPTSFGADQDPWASPELHRGHNHSASVTEQPTNGFGSVRSTTSGWGNANTVVSDALRGATNGQSSDVTPVTSAPGWGALGNPTAPFGSPDRAPILGGFGGQPGGRESFHAPSRSIGGGIVTGSGAEDVITVTLLPEKEGMFMFQHRNYEVKSTRRGSSVVRRYSDFVWLLDCLHRRYPFRQLPLLPPKRVAVNGTHLAADSNSFLEKRRRGLVRFINAVARHPVLSQEQLVVMFLTVPTELSVWRKQATVSIQDEFTGRVLPPDLEDSLPPNLNEIFDTVRAGVKRSAEIYINLCNLLERLAKRNEGLAADHMRFSLALRSLSEATKAAYAVDTNDVPLLNEGILATARHLAASQTLLEDEARAWQTGVLEDLKRQRDCLVSMRELFDRRDRYAKDNIPQLEKRIEANERKLQELRARPPGAVKPGEIEKVEEAIVKDKESIVQQHARGVFIKQTIREELYHFQQSQYHISRLHQDWSQERVKYAELQADNWRQLASEVENMPTGE